MQPTLCSRCGKNPAVVFITKLEAALIADIKVGNAVPFDQLRDRFGQPRSDGRRRSEERRVG